MRLVVTTEYRFYRTPDGSYWATSAFARPFWDRYLEVFEQVRVVARARTAVEPPPTAVRSDGENVEFCPVPYYVGPGQFLQHAPHVYGFYKGAGSDVVTLSTVPNAQILLEERTQRTFSSVLLGDLGRSDVQALLLERMMTPGNNLSYAWGRTYLGAITLAVPSSLSPNRIPTKIKEGTDVLYGKGTYQPFGFYATNQYGFAGEAMLNFGPFAALLAFVILGLMTAWTKDLARRWRWGDVRLLILPLLICICFLVLVYDSDNVLFFLLKYISIPFLIVWVGSERGPRGIQSQ